MAGNKKIFDLPLRTGVTADDRLAIVDSGNTTTYSVKLSDLQDGTGVNTLESLTGNITFSGTNIDITTSGQTIYLSGSTGGGGGSSPFIDADGTNNVVSDYYATSAINSGTSENVIIGGTGNTINIGNNQAIIGGKDNELNGIGSVMFGGNTNEIDSSNCAYNAVVAGFNNFMTNQDTGFMGGGIYNDLTNGENDAIIGGGQNLLNDGRLSNILGGQYNTIQFARNSAIAGSYGSYIRGDERATPLGIYGSDTCKINRAAATPNSSFEGTNSGIYSSYFSEIAGQSANETNRGVIIGSNNTYLTGGTTNTLMLGCSGRTGTNSYTTYVETLEAFEGIVLNDYSNLNFSGDTAAATGGVPLGGLYHDAGDLRVRIT